MPKTYYNPNLADSEITVSPDEVSKFLGGEQTLQRSGYVERTPRYNADGTPKTNDGTAGTSTTAPSFMTQDQFIADRQNKTAVDEAAIREEIRKQQQARIDAINGAYDQMIIEDRVRGRDRLGQNRALQSHSGLTGSDFGFAHTDKVKTINAKEEAATNAERNMKIQGVMDKIDELTRERVKAQKDEALGNITAYQEYVDKANASAKDSLKALGESGVSYEDLKAKAPDQLKTLLDSTGYDEFTLAQIMNNNKRAADKIDYTYKTVGNKILGYGVNPRTGNIETVEKDIDLGEEDNLQDYSPTVTPDGTLIMVPKKLDPSKPLNEQIKVFGAEGQYAKQGKATGGGGGGGGGKKKDPLQTVINGINSGVKNGQPYKWLGADGKLSPQDYILIRNQWIADGNSPTVFDTKMKGYRDPNNSYYGTEKAPKKTTTTETGSGPFD